MATTILLGLPVLLFLLTLPVVMESNQLPPVVTKPLRPIPTRLPVNCDQPATSRLQNSCQPFKSAGQRSISQLTHEEDLSPVLGAKHAIPRTSGAVNAQLLIEYPKTTKVGSPTSDRNIGKLKPVAPRPAS
jgi:hypothetical protein